VICHPKIKRKSDILIYSKLILTTSLSLLSRRDEESTQRTSKARNGRVPSFQKLTNHFFNPAYFILSCASHLYIGTNVGPTSPTMLVQRYFQSYADFIQLYARLYCLLALFKQIVSEFAIQDTVLACLPLVSIVNLLEFLYLLKSRIGSEPTNTE
jgi:hypothetical protein